MFEPAMSLFHPTFPENHTYYYLILLLTVM
jgi:hypothetical protein